MAFCIMYESFDMLYERNDLWIDHDQDPANQATG